MQIEMEETKVGMASNCQAGLIEETDARLILAKDKTHDPGVRGSGTFFSVVGIENWESWLTIPLTDGGRRGHLSP